MRWKGNLIKLCFCNCEDKGTQRYLSGLRMSNNQTLSFTDEEVMTVYIFGITRKYSKVKDIYNYTKCHLSDWFPLLPGYQGFNDRLNRWHGCFEILVQSIARPVLNCMNNCKIYADKMYADSDLNSKMQANQNSIILTPAKKEKGQKIVDAADDIYSYLVSQVRQPIESLFNWIIEKTQIQFAQRVRSERGLLVHVWGKFVAALFLLSNFLSLD